MTRIVRAGIAAALLAGSIGLAACSGTTTDPKPPATHTVPAPKATIPAPAPKPTTAEQTAAWYAEASADLDAITRHNGEVADLFADPSAIMADPAPAEHVLGQLIDDVDNLRAHGPVPMPNVDRPFQKALDAYGTAYPLVLDGVRILDTDPATAAIKFDRGATLMNQGTAYINQATDAIGTVNV